MKSSQRALVCAACWVLLGGDPAAAETRPTIGAAISLCCASGVATNSLAALPERAVAERELAETVIRSVAARYPFVLWSSAPAAGTPTLLARLVEFPAFNKEAW